MKQNKKRMQGLALFAVCVMVFLLSACAAAPTAAPDKDVPVPSNAGGPGEAVNLTGDVANGAKIYTANCTVCHGADGKGGVANAGSTDGTVPPLSPIDDSLVSKDAKTFAKNIDLFVEHGSKPEGSAPTLSMLAFGDNKTLKPQEIADVIAYVISLNK